MCWHAAMWNVLKEPEDQPLNNNFQNVLKNDQKLCSPVLATYHSSSKVCSSGNQVNTYDCLLCKFLMKCIVFE